MLIRHILSYLVARGAPGIINLIALMVYTRLLTSGEFGRYSVIIATIGLIHVLVYEWLNLICTRFTPAHADEPKDFLGALLSIFLILSGIGAVIGILIALLWVKSPWTILVIIAIPLTFIQAWNGLTLNYFAAQLQPRLYGLMGLVGTISALAMATILAILGWGAIALLIGLLVGGVAAFMVIGRRVWVGIRPSLPDPDQARKYARYGVPLALVFSLTWITASSDRLLISIFLDESQTGLYAVGYDLARQTLTLLLSIVNTAAISLAIKSLEAHGADAAREQMRQNGQIMFALAFAGAAGLIAIGPVMMELFVGSEFHQGALLIFPWIAVAAAITGLKAYYFDIAFHLSRQSKWLIVTSGLAAISNIVLNVVFIPRYGILGAAWSAIIAYTLAMISSAFLGRYVFSMPRIFPLLIHGLVPACAVYFPVRLFMTIEIASLFKLIGCLIIGSFAFGIAALALNTGGIRTNLIKIAR